MASFPQLAIRGFTFLWVLLTMALVGNVIADAFAGNASSINYAIFVSTFDMLVLIIGIAAAFMDLSSFGLILLALDGLAALFTLIAGIVLAAKLGVHSCGNQVNRSFSQNILEGIYQQLNSLTLTPTTLQTAPTTQERDATSFKLAQLSTGLLSSDLSHLLSFLAWDREDLHP